MKHLIYVLCIILVCASINVHAHQCNGVNYKKNQFGDIFPEWEEIPNQNFTETLSKFIECANKEEKNPVIKIDIPLEKSSYIHLVKSSGFELFAATSAKIEFIVRNGVSIPDPFTAVAGSQVLLIDGEKVL